MQPNSINEVLKFLRNTKPGCSFNILKKNEEDIMEFDDINPKGINNELGRHESF